MPDPTLVSRLADTIGASEPALRLLLSLLLGYPIAFLHRHGLYSKTPSLQHAYFIFMGLSLGYFNYGLDMIHSVICIFILYIILCASGGTLLSVVVSFVIFMGYLLIGYYQTGTQDYDIKWTLPHCILTLRLIGVAFDVYDGKKNPDKLSAEQRKTALPKCPSLLEIAAHTYFFGGFMVGPQFSMTRYLDFVNGRFCDRTTGGTPACVTAAVGRLCLGLVLMVIYQAGVLIIPERYILTDAFQDSAFWQKIFLLSFWGKICLYKYVACWLLAEGSCILTGLTHNGKDENGNDLWDGCANVKIWCYETTTTFDGLIRSFNVNTNLWVSQYIFKRLKFLGNKLVSQAAALLFLAVWHGLHSGYYVVFFNEFVVMKMEKEFAGLVDNMPAVKKLLNNGALQIPLFLLRKLYVLFFFAYCIVPFVLLSFDRWWKGYASVYFIGHIIYLGWPLVYPLLRRVVKKRSLKVNGGKDQ